MRLASEFRLLGPLAVTALGAMAAFVLSLTIWRHEVDAGARLREETLVLQGVLARITEIEEVVASQIDGGATATELGKPTAPAWARDRLLVGLSQAAEFDDLAVLRGDDVPMDDAAGDMVARLGARPLVDEVRGAEAKLLAAGARPTEPGLIQRSAFTAQGGMIRLVTATLVPLAPALTRKGAIILSSQTLASGFLTLMRDRFQVAPITAEVGAPARPDLAAVRFDTAGHGPPLVLSWVPLQPGADLLARAAWPTLGVLLAFGGVGLVMMWQVRRAARELVASNRAQSQFLANMSHEIRTPLNGVVAIAGALSRTALTPQQGELVEIIRTSGVSLERLLSDVLDLARIETGAVAIENEPFNLAEAVQGAVSLYRSRADEKGIGLTLRIDPAADTVVVGDQMRLKQILTNLISNAIKFTAEGGVSITVAENGPEAWRFTIVDTGVGFDPALRERIFGRFQQADGSVTRRFGGTGLGLAICKQLSELMGGTIEAQGQPGAGACFTVVAPFARRQGATPEPAVAAAPVAQIDTPADCPAAPTERRLRVLLADDHPTNRRVVEILLADLDLDLIITENGLQACEAFEADGFDAVLMDMQMPVMDGLTATRRIRAFESRQGRTPAFVVMLTANALRDHQDASLAAGADLHLPKPIEAARLFAALAQAGEQAAQLQAA